MSDIPTEVYFEILCRVPVEPLLKFRCVCKSWKAIIDSKRFGKMHLIISETNPKLMLCRYTRWSLVSFEYIDNHTRNHALPDSFIPAFSYPANNDNIPTFVMGHCDGLLLIACGIDCAVWNPSTCMYTVLPYLEDKRPKEIDTYHYLCGFGYDKITDDYKVLRILQVAGDDKSCPQTVVYSLKSRCYRRIKDFPVMNSQLRYGIFVFGALHWVVLCPSETSGQGQYMILAFDLGNEEYNWVHLPLHLPLHLGACKLSQVDLSVFEGCLSLSCSYECKHVDIWLLRDPRKRTSWFKLFSLEVDGNWDFQENVIPISYSKCGKYVILVKDNTEVLWYDLELKLLRKIRLDHGYPIPCSNTLLFSESLVSMDQVAEERDQEIKKKKTKKSLVGGVEVSKKMHQAAEKTKTKKRDDFLSTGFKLKL